jgi:hypothetical protein
MRKVERHTGITETDTKRVDIDWIVTTILCEQLKIVNCQIDEVE